MPIWRKGVSEAKDPDAVKRIQWDLTPWLNGMSLQTYAVTVKNVTLNSTSQDGNIVIAFVSGGNACTEAMVTLRATRSDTKKDDFSIKLKVDER